jgi:hypothetical protein
MRTLLNPAAAGATIAGLVAAAFLHAHWAYADALWTATFFAVVYATVLAAYARGRVQGAAAGFAVASLLTIAALQFADGPLAPARAVAAIFPLEAAPQPTPAVATVPRTVTYQVARTAPDGNTHPNLK